VTRFAIILWCVTVTVMAMPVRASQEVIKPSMKGLIPYWTGIVDITGHCQYSVPPTWRSDREGHEDDIARAPDGGATVQQSWHSALSWISYTTNLRQLLKPTAVLEDSAQRFWFVYSAGWPGVHTFVATPTVAGACAAEIDVRAGATDRMTLTIRQIVESILAIR
jgi:hypothetical protein